MTRVRKTHGEGFKFKVALAALKGDRTLGEGMILGAEQLGDDGIVDPLADLLADELGGEVVGLLVAEQVGEGGHEVESAVVPAPLELALPFFRRDFLRLLLVTVAGYTAFRMCAATATVSPCWLVTVIAAVARPRAGSVALIS